MTESVECAVIGAGVVGLAVARSVALAGREVVVLEQHDRIGEETSSRNSEVIHAGIYYPTGSLKARLCVTGRSSLYAYCEERGIPHRRCGKLIVALDPAQLARLRGIDAQARENGVLDLEWVEAEALRGLEPQLEGIAALLSPSTGILDVHALMLAYRADIEAAGGAIVTGTRLLSGNVGAGGVELSVESAGETSRVRARTVVNAAGLHASRVARKLLGGTAAVPETRYAKGNYFAYRGPSPFTHLVYPLPVPGGLGIHATLDLAGSVRFGPDVEWIDTLDYDVDAGRRDAFATAIAEYWPGLSAAELEPSYCGIRPKLHGPGADAADFHIARSGAGAGPIVQLLGIESPGLTASLAIGDYVRDLLQR